MKKYRILAVDDESTILTLLSTSLQEYEVETTSSGTEALARLYERKPDLILLDVRMPDIDGFELCRIVRQQSQVPIILLTALRNEQDIVQGLDAGADDYITKPFSIAELVARIRASLRRSQSDLSADRRRLLFDNGHLVIDLNQRTVMVGQRLADLTPSEFRLLTYLLARAGQIVPNRELADHLWETVTIERVSHVKVYIRALRHKIEPDPSQPRYILSHHGSGYSFDAVPCPVTT